MKKARIVLLEQQYQELQRLVFDRPGVEGAAFLLCGQSRTSKSEKLIGSMVVPIADEDYLRREWDGLSLASQAFVRIAKQARTRRLSIVFVHSHPGGVAHFSAQDDREEERLLPFLRDRVPSQLHGTLVLAPGTIAGRIYSHCRMTASVLVVGSRIRLHAADTPSRHAPIFDRQVRAFGEASQRLLGELHVGIVGLGGTGSATAEMLYRLGVGELSLFDGDCLDSTNLNRVIGSRASDVGLKKVELAKRHLDGIGLGTRVVAFPEHITSESTALALRDCDVLFGCTDKQVPRAILIQVALRYNLPVFDLGVLVDSDAEIIRAVLGRVTTFLPGEACLLCRGRISPTGMRIEALSPEDRADQIREGYAPALDEPAPAVIPFTSGMASFATSELLHRVTGFMGSNRQSSEVLIEFDKLRIRTNRVQPGETCICTDRSLWGSGDERPFLGMAWPTHTT